MPPTGPSFWPPTESVLCFLLLSLEQPTNAPPATSVVRASAPALNSDLISMDLLKILRCRTRRCVERRLPPIQGPRQTPQRAPAQHNVSYRNTFLTLSSIWLGAS